MPLVKVTHVDWVNGRGISMVEVWSNQTRTWRLAFVSTNSTEALREAREYRRHPERVPEIASIITETA